MSEPESFDIIWRNGAYYVSIPNYQGGTVYTSERYESVSKLNHHRAGIIERCMDMLGDVPGQSLEDRLTKLQGWYLEMQFLVGDLKHKLEVAQTVNRLTAEHVGCPSDERGEA